MPTHDAEAPAPKPEIPLWRAKTQTALARVLVAAVRRRMVAAATASAAPRDQGGEPAGE